MLRNADYRSAALTESRSQTSPPGQTLEQMIQQSTLLSYNAGILEPRESKQEYDRTVGSVLRNAD